MRKMMKSIAAVLAVSALMAGSAFAADKLVVKDTNGSNTVFAVTDGGSTSGTNDVAEQMRSERTSTSTTAAGFGVKSTKYLKVGSSLLNVNEQEVKVSSTTAGAEGTTFMLRNYNNGALRDVLEVVNQPVFYRYLPTGTWSSPQAAATFALRKGNGAFGNGTGPRMAFQTEDISTTNMLLVGALSFPYDFTNSRSSLVFAVRGGPSDTFASTEALRVTYDGKLGLGTTDPKSKIHVVGLPQYDTVVAAQSAGLTSGAIFRTSGNVLMIVP